MAGQTNDSNQGTFLQKEEHCPLERFAGLLRRKVTGLLVLAGTLTIVAPAFSQSLSEIDARAGSFFSQGNFKKAEAAYGDAIALDGNNAILFYNRGLARFKLHAYAGALDDFNKAVSIDPKNADLLNGRGGAYLMMQKFADAVNDFDRALSIQPDNPVSKENLKRAEVGLRAYDAAIRSTIDSRYGAVAVSLGNHHVWGSAENWATAAAAEAFALIRCRKSANDCKVLTYESNTCLALAAQDVGNNGWTTGTGPSEMAARDQAFQTCLKTASACSVLYSNCSLAYVRPVAPQTVPSGAPSTIARQVQSRPRPFQCRSTFMPGLSEANGFGARWNTACY